MNALAALGLLALAVAPASASAQARDIVPEATAAKAVQGKPEIFVQLGNLSDVDSVAFSPDGRTIASAGDHTVKLWDLASGRELRTLRGDVGVTSVAFSPDGRLVASADYGKTLKLWDAASGRELRTLSGHSGPLTALAFSPDGRLVASASDDKTLKLWDAASGRELRTLSGHSAPVTSVAFSPDGRTIASGGDDNAIKLWEVVSGHQRRTLAGHPRKVSAVAFSVDGRRLASGSWDGTVKLWDVATGRELGELNAHAGQVHSVAFSPDGRRLASGNENNTVTLWDVATGQVLSTLSGHSDKVKSVAFSRDGRALASGSADRSVRLWDVASGRELRTLRGRGVFMWSTAFSPDGRLVATASGDTIKLWEVASGRELRSLKGHAEPITSVAISPDGLVLASGSWDKSVRLWEMASGREIRTLRHSDTVRSVAFSPDGRTLATGSENHSSGEQARQFLTLWDVTSGREVRTWSGHSDDVWSVAFSPDGRTLASASSDSTVKLWDVASGREMLTLRDQSPSAIAFSRDGSVLISTEPASGLTPAPAIKFWDLRSGRELRTLIGHSFGVFSLAVAPDGRTVASGSADGTIRLWDAASGRELWRSLAAEPGTENPVAFSPDGRTLAAGTGTALRLLDVATGKERVALISFEDGSSLTITPEGYYDVSSEAAEENLSVRVGDQVFGIGAYRETFYRPDLVRLALAGQSLGAFARLDQVKAAPRVELLDLPQTTSAPQLTVKVRLIDSGGGIGDVRLFLNGSAVVQRSARDIVPEAVPAVRSFTVRLVNGRNELRAVAFNADNSMQSNPATAEIQASLTVTRPSLYGVVVGIQDFKNPALKLKYPVADARLFADVLRRLASPLFQKVELTLLTTPHETTRDSVMQALQAVRPKVGPDDLFVFFVASHGTVDDGEYFLVTSNVGAASTVKLKTDAVSQTQLKELLANIPATKKLIVIDTCNAGALGDTLQVAFLTRGMSDITAMKILGRAVGSTVLSASTSTQQALEGYQGHGVFTYVLAEGLRGKADADGDGFVSTLELATYVDNRVPALAEQVFKHAQYPIVSPSGQGFPLVKVR